MLLTNRRSLLVSKRTAGYYLSVAINIYFRNKMAGAAPQSTKFLTAAALVHIWILHGEKCSLIASHTCPSWTTATSQIYHSASSLTFPNPNSFQRGRRGASCEHSSFPNSQSLWTSSYRKKKPSSPSWACVKNSCPQKLSPLTRKCSSFHR